MVKLIHIADFHASKERKTQCLYALESLKELVIKEQEKDGITPVVLFAGDFWDSTITNTEVSGFSDYIKSMKEISDITEIYMITGTASHDPNGSYGIFESLGIKVFTQMRIFYHKDFNITAIPEPRKTDYIEKNSVEISKKILKTIKQFLDKGKKHPRVNILLYHGEVNGAVYQNGVISGTSENSYAIPSSWLKDFDYCALGHIHAPQQIKGTNAYYSGSVPAKDFGETHEQGVNLVTIDELGTKVQRVIFDFPVNLTEEVSYEDIQKIKNRDYTGKRVHLKVKIDKLLKRSFNSEELKKELLAATNAIELKMTFDYSQTSNVRSERIAQQKSSVDKFKTYAEINGIHYKNSILDKIRNIQDNMLIEQFIPCESFSLEYLSLRGSIGIKDGLGKDEIEIDFNKYSDGVLALIGANGAGKTTIIENCHPFPQMLTRGGSLRDHFCLKDSHRILIYKTDSGKYYKITMQIDGVAKVVGTKYFVQIKKSENEEWQNYLSVDGSYDSYKEWVFHTFGTVDLFLRTSFFAKEQVKGIPDLSRATKAEKMELFSVLAGTDYLSVFADKSKEKQKEIQEKIVEAKAGVKNFDEIKSRLESCKSERDGNLEEIEKYAKLLELDNAELEIFKSEQEKYIAVEKNLSMIAQNLKAQRQLKDNYQREYDTLCIQVEEIKNLLLNKDVFQQQSDWYAENSQKREDLKEEIASTKEVLQGMEIQYSDYIQKVSELEREKNSVEKESSNISFKIEMLEDKIPQTDGLCPVCGAPLSEHKLEEIRIEQQKKEQELKALKKKLSELTFKQNQLETELQKYDVKSFAETIKEKRKIIDSAQSDIDMITAYISGLDFTKIDFVLNNAEKELQENLVKKQELSVKLEEVKRQVKELDDLNKNQPKDHSDKIKRLERGIQDSQEKLATYKASVKLLEMQISDLAKYSDDIQKIENELKELESDLKEYSIIEKAFSNNGIQALELDSAAPEISEIANAILLETYGDRFSISFETQRELASGKKKIDDFIINIFDSETGRIKKLDSLCSGESVWIKQALYYAFSILRTRRTGFCFKTRFLDESDGALDSVARAKYIRMIEAAHKACNSRLTVLITHSQELKDIIEQKLELIPRKLVA